MSLKMSVPYQISDVMERINSYLDRLTDERIFYTPEDRNKLLDRCEDHIIRLMENPHPFDDYDSDEDYDGCIDNYGELVSRELAKCRNRVTWLQQLQRRHKSRISRQIKEDNKEYAKKRKAAKDEAKKPTGAKKKPAVGDRSDLDANEDQARLQAETPIIVNKNVAMKRSQFVNGEATSIDEKNEVSNAIFIHHFF